MISGSPGLVVGASGYLGSAIWMASGGASGRPIGAAGTCLHRPVPGCVPYDFFADPIAALLDASPALTTVFFAAAVERQPLREEFGRATERFVQQVGERDLKLVYVSSDAVFSGERGAYSERDAPDAQTLYGRQLRFFEAEVAKRVARHLIVRVSYLFGDTATHQDRRILEARSALARSEPFYRYANVYKSPVNVADAARSIVHLAASPATGVVHLAAPRKSLFGFYRERCAALGMETDFILPRIASAEAVDGFDTSLISERVP